MTSTMTAGISEQACAVTPTTPLRGVDRSARRRLSGGSAGGLEDCLAGEVDGVAEGGVGDVGVALGGLVVAVAEHLADDLEGDALHDGVAGDGVAEVVDAQVGHAGELAEATPGAAEAVQLVAGAGADDPAALRLVLGRGDLAEQGDHGVGDDDVSLARLAVGEAQDAAVPVDLVPL